MEKGYIIMFLSLDGPTCEDDGLFNCYAFNACTDVFPNRASAEDARKSIMERDASEFKSNWLEEDGYLVKIEEGYSEGDYEINIYSSNLNGDVINKTIYRIAEVKINSL